jgi:hypothetical protein
VTGGPPARSTFAIPSLPPVVSLPPVSDQYTAAASTAIAPAPVRSSTSVVTTPVSSDAFITVPLGGPPMNQLPQVVQYTFVASMAGFDGMYCCEATTTGVPPSSGSFRIAPSAGCVASPGRAQQTCVGPTVTAPSRAVRSGTSVVGAPPCLGILAMPLVLWSVQ